MQRIRVVEGAPVGSRRRENVVEQRALDQVRVLVLASGQEEQAVIGQETAHVAARRSNLNSALAWSADRWAVDQAAAETASVIYLEDLRSMEARGMSRTMNVRLSQTVRGQIVQRIRHLAAKEGIAVVTVPARGTSRHCPRCLGVLRHCKAPDRQQVPGWKWARCPGCGWQGDRDAGAWQRIAARGLAHQHKTSAGRTSGAMTIRTVDDECEQHAVITVPSTACNQDRSKAGPTPRKVSHAARPGDARHPPPRRAGYSVRGDAPQRPGQAGTRARTRSAPLPPPATARTRRAGPRSAPASTGTPTPRHHDGNRSTNHQVNRGSLS